MNILVTLDDGFEFEIELIDSPFVYEWAEQIPYIEIKNTERVKLTSAGCDSNFYNASIANILDLIETATEAGIPLPDQFKDYPLEDASTEEKRKYANDAHHWVVCCQRNLPHPEWGNDDVRKMIHENNSLNIPGGLFNKFNHAVHSYETTFPRTFTSLHNTEEEKCYWDVEFGFENWEDRYFRRGADFKSEVNSMLTTKHHTVWFAKRILGKDWRECWLDSDDPTRPEMTNIDDHIQFSFEIDFNNREEFYTSDRFKQWFADHDLEYSEENIGRLAIGNVIGNETEVQKRIDNGQQIIKLQIIRS